MNGEIIYNLVSKFPLVDDNGKPKGLCGIITNITEVKKQQAQIESQSNYLSEMTQEFENFSYSASHHLLEPLNSIRCFSKSLSKACKGVLDEKSNEQLRMIHEYADQMDVQVKGLMKFSYVAGKQLKKDEVDMDEVVANILKSERAKYPNHKIQINKESLLHAYGDSKTIRQVWQNILNNAFKFSSEKDIITIDISSREDDTHVYYSVKDYGVGFDHQYNTHIFDIFYRLQDQPAFEGIGMGLSVAKKIVQMHGGYILANGKKGKGATIEFTLPKNSESSASLKIA